MNFFDKNDLEIDTINTKICMHCNTEKPISAFWRNRTGHDNRCMACHTGRKRDVEKLRRDPSTPKMPDRCQCCGRENQKKLNIPGKMGYNLNLDHYYDNGKPFFRGWVCKQCNSGIGYLGDDINGVFNAIDYLIRSLPEEKWIMFKSMISEEKNKTIKRLEEINDKPIQRCDPVDPPKQKKRSRK